MDTFERYRLEKEGDSYILILYVNPNTTEFSREPGFFENNNGNSTSNSVQRFIKKRLPDYKIKSVRVILGSSLLGVIPVSNQGTEASKSSPYNSVNSYAYYTAASGDTLQYVADKFKTSVEEIKHINQLTTEKLFRNQVLKVPTGTENPSPENHISAGTYSLWSILNQFDKESLH